MLFYVLCDVWMASVPMNVDECILSMRIGFAHEFLNDVVNG